MTCLASGCRAEWRGWDDLPHNSPFLARAWCLMDETIPQIVAAGHLPGLPGDSRNRRPLGWPGNRPNERFPLPLQARCSATLRTVRAGRDEFPADLPGELLNLASITALRVCFWSLNLVYFRCKRAHYCCMNRLQRSRFYSEQSAARPGTNVIDDPRFNMGRSSTWQSRGLRAHSGIGVARRPLG
jgi:hypothetical protein